METGEKPFACTICGKKLKNEKCLNRHLRFHSEENLHECSECDRQFLYISDLKEHRKVHTGEKPFACTMCDKKFTSSSGLTAHLRLHSPALNATRRSRKRPIWMSIVELTLVKNHSPVIFVRRSLLKRVP